MPNNYLVKRFSIRFIEILMQISKEGLLQYFDKKPGRIVFPFCAHFFHMLNAKESIASHFHLTYLTVDDLTLDEVNREKHKLSYSTNCHKDEIGQTKFFEEQEVYITCTRKAIIDYSSGLLLTKNKVVDILKNIADVEKIRYIVLSQKQSHHNVTDLFSLYTITLAPIVQLPENFLSRLLFLNNSIVLIELARYIIIRLVYNMPCSIDGICIAADKPGSNNWQLNIVRPSVLRQIYGVDICLMDGNKVQRYAYGLGKTTTSEGTDPSRVAIKPFCDNLQLMSVILHNVLVENKVYLNLLQVNTNEKFNSCVILQYFTITDLKHQCGMGWHCDSKYNKKGEFLHNSNTQLINTPVVIFTIGLPRILKWRKRCLQKD